MLVPSVFRTPPETAAPDSERSTGSLGAHSFMAARKCARALLAARRPNETLGLAL